MRIKTKNIKVGDEYYFVNTYFQYYSIRFNSFISKEKIYRIIGNDFSTKNEGWLYEKQRFIGFKTETEAKDFLIKEIKSYKKYLIKEINIEYEKALNKLKK